MDPYNKGLRISAIIHGVVVVALLITIAWSQLKPRTTETFTLVAGPPKGMIAGGTASQTPKTSNVAPQAPKLAQPPQKVAQQKSKPATKNIAPKTNLTPVKAPKPVVKKTPAPKTPKQIPPAPPKKISFSDFQKDHSDSLDKQKQYYDKLAAKQKAQPKQKTESYDDFAKRLDKRLSQMDNSAGATSQNRTTAGSGEMGNGIAGATQDLEKLYSASIHTYLNNLWKEPRDLGGARLSAQVEFVVDRSGTIQSWRIKRSSGVSEFDKSVANVFERIRTVPQPPKAMDYKLSVTFETRNG